MSLTMEPDHIFCTMLFLPHPTSTCTHTSTPTMQCYQEWAMSFREIQMRDIDLISNVGEYQKSKGPAFTPLLTMMPSLTIALTSGLFSEVWGFCVMPAMQCHQEWVKGFGWNSNPSSLSSVFNFPHMGPFPVCKGNISSLCHRLGSELEACLLVYKNLAVSIILQRI